MVHAFSAAAGSRANTARTIMARSSSLDVNWRFPSAVLSLLPEVKIEWAQVWRWISRSLENALVRRLVCDGALSSCPPARCICAQARHALWQVHVVQHPNVALGVDAHTLFDEAQREHDSRAKRFSAVNLGARTGLKHRA